MLSVGGGECIEWLTVQVSAPSRWEAADVWSSSHLAALVLEKFSGKNDSNNKSPIIPPPLLRPVACCHDTSSASWIVEI